MRIRVKERRTKLHRWTRVLWTFCIMRRSWKQCESAIFVAFRFRGLKYVCDKKKKKKEKKIENTRMEKKNGNKLHRITSLDNLQGSSRWTWFFANCIHCIHVLQATCTWWLLAINLFSSILIENIIVYSFYFRYQNIYIYPIINDKMSVNHKCYNDWMEVTRLSQTNSNQIYYHNLLLGN